MDWAGEGPEALAPADRVVIVTDPVTSAAKKTLVLLPEPAKKQELAIEPSYEPTARGLGAPQPVGAAQVAARGLRGFQPLPPGAPHKPSRTTPGGWVEGEV